ncbi:MAG: tetratricopeptide repeat protein, partial [Pseudomonadota bacterium]
MKTRSKSIFVFSIGFLFVALAAVGLILGAARSVSAQDDAAQYFGRGLSFLDQNQYDQAIEEFKKAVELKPDYAEAYVNIGLCWERKGAFDSAVEAYTQAIKIKP